MGYEARPACGRPSAHRPREFAGAPEAIWAWRFGALEKTSGEGSSGELPGTRGGGGVLFGRSRSFAEVLEEVRVARLARLVAAAVELNDVRKRARQGLGVTQFATDSVAGDVEHDDAGSAQRG